MSLNANEMKQLRRAFCQHIADASSLRLTIEDSGLNASRIALSGSLEVRWHNVLVYASSQGTQAINQLLKTALEVAPVLREEATIQGVLFRYGLTAPASGSPSRGSGSLNSAGFSSVDLLDQIKKLLPSQFEELLFRAEVPSSILPGSHAPQMSRSVALLKWADAGPPSRMQNLERVLIKVAGPLQSNETSPRAEPRTPNSTQNSGPLTAHSKPATIKNDASPPGENFTYHALISHSSVNKVYARTLYNYLTENGLNIWFDEVSIGWGEALQVAIGKGIRQSRHIILLVSEASSSSEWVEREHLLTTYHDPANRRRRILPLKIEPCEIPDSLKPFKVPNAFGLEGLEAALPMILKTLLPD